MCLKIYSTWYGPTKPTTMLIALYEIILMVVVTAFIAYAQLQFSLS